MTPSDETSLTDAPVKDIEMHNKIPTLSLADAAWLSATIERNHTRFGGWSMGPVGETPAATPPATPPGATPPATTPPAGQQPPAADPSADAGKGGKDAILADLAKERDKRQALEAKVTGFETTMQNLAKAFGLPEGTGAAGDGQGATSDVNAQIQQLQEQFAATQREATLLKVAAAPGVDAEGKPLPAIPPEFHHLLTATDADGLAAQAKSVAQLVAVQAAQNQTPGFAASAGQGQNGGTTPPLPAQIAAAETELQGKTRGTPEYRATEQRVMALKSQQLFAAAQSTK